MKFTFAVMTMVGIAAFGASGARTVSALQEKTVWDGVYTEEQA